MRLRAPAAPRLEDAKAEQARREHERAIAELQGLLAAGMHVIQDVEIGSNSSVQAPHNLGRAPVFVQVSSPRNSDGTDFASTGRIVELRGATYDRTRFVTLQATGWGRSVLVDILVM